MFPTRSYLKNCPKDLARKMWKIQKHGTKKEERGPKVGFSSNASEYRPSTATHVSDGGRQQYSVLLPKLQRNLHDKNDPATMDPLGESRRSHEPAPPPRCGCAAGCHIYSLRRAAVHNEFPKIAYTQIAVHATPFPKKSMRQACSLVLLLVSDFFRLNSNLTVTALTVTALAAKSPDTKKLRKSLSTSTQRVSRRQSLLYNGKT